MLMGVAGWLDGLPATRCSNARFRKSGVAHGERRRFVDAKLRINHQDLYTIALS